MILGGCCVYSYGVSPADTSLCLLHLHGLCASKSQKKCLTVKSCHDIAADRERGSGLSYAMSIKSIPQSRHVVNRLLSNLFERYLHAYPLCSFRNRLLKKISCSSSSKNPRD